MELDSLFQLLPRDIQIRILKILLSDMDTRIRGQFVSKLRIPYYIQQNLKQTLRPPIETTHNEVFIRLGLRQFPNSDLWYPMYVIRYTNQDLNSRFRILNYTNPTYANSFTFLEKENRWINWINYRQILCVY